MMMNPVETWKLVAVIAVFVSGFCGSATAPLMQLIRNNKNSARRRRQRQQGTIRQRGVVAPTILLTTEDGVQQQHDDDNASVDVEGGVGGVAVVEVQQGGRGGEGRCLVGSGPVGGRKGVVVVADVDDNQSYPYRGGGGGGGYGTVDGGVASTAGTVVVDVVGEQDGDGEVVAAGGDHDINDDNNGGGQFAQLWMLFVERLATSVGCGVMLTTALVHVLPDAEDDLTAAGWIDDLNGFPITQVVCLVGILAAYLFHLEVHYKVDNEKQPVARMHMLEAGLVVHSVLIGFAMGVSQELQGLRGLTIAMIFHQMCEGFALGTAVSHAADTTTRQTTGNVQQRISKAYQLFMICLFAASTPAGVVIGWAGVSSENADHPSSRATQGVLSSLAAGILICSALCDFMPTLYATMPGHEHHGDDVDDNDSTNNNNNSATYMWKLDPTRRPSRFVLHVALAAGAAGMSVLAIWS